MSSACPERLHRVWKAAGHDSMLCVLHTSKGHGAAETGGHARGKPPQWRTTHRVYIQLEDLCAEHLPMAPQGPTRFQIYIELFHRTQIHFFLSPSYTCLRVLSSNTQQDRPPVSEATAHLGEDVAMITVVQGRSGPPSRSPRPGSWSPPTWAAERARVSRTPSIRCHPPPRAFCSQCFHSHSLPLCFL